MELENATFVTLPLKNWKQVEQDLYNLHRKIDALQTGTLRVEWKPFASFLEATTWKKTLFHDKRKVGKFPKHLVLKRGRKVFIHESAWDKFFAGDFD